MKVKTVPELVKETPQRLQKKKKILLHFYSKPTTKRLKLHRKKKRHSETTKAHAV